MADELTTKAKEKYNKVKEALKTTSRQDRNAKLLEMGFEYVEEESDDTEKYEENNAVPANKRQKVIVNRVESPFTETPSHTTVQAMSHTAVLLLCLPKANERLKSPNLLNHSRFIALCTI